MSFFVSVVSVVFAGGSIHPPVAAVDYWINVSIGTGVKHTMKITSARTATA